MICANVHKGGSKQSLAFPSLITSLCEDAGVPVVRSQKIRESIDKKYFRNHCADRDPNAPPAPPPQVPPRTMEDLWGRISTRLDHHDKQFAALHQGMTSLHISHYSMAQHSIPGQTFFSHRRRLQHIWIGLWTNQFHRGRQLEREVKEVVVVGKTTGLVAMGTSTSTII